METVWMGFKTKENLIDKLNSLSGDELKRYVLKSGGLRYADIRGKGGDEIKEILIHDREVANKMMEMRRKQLREEDMKLYPSRYTDTNKKPKQSPQQKFPLAYLEQDFLNDPDVLELSGGGDNIIFVGKKSKKTSLKIKSR